MTTIYMLFKTLFGSRTAPKPASKTTKIDPKWLSKTDMETDPQTDLKNFISFCNVVLDTVFESILNRFGVDFGRFFDRILKSYVRDV